MLVEKNSEKATAHIMWHIASGILCRWSSYCCHDSVGASRCEGQNEHYGILPPIKTHAFRHVPLAQDRSSSKAAPHLAVLERHNLVQVGPEALEEDLVMNHRDLRQCGVDLRRKEKRNTQKIIQRQAQIHKYVHTRRKKGLPV